MVLGLAEHKEFFHCRIVPNPTTGVNIHEVLLHCGTFDSDMNNAVECRAVVMCVTIVTFFRLGRSPLAKHSLWSYNIGLRHPNGKTYLRHDIQDDYKCVHYKSSAQKIASHVTRKKLDL